MPDAEPRFPDVHVHLGNLNGPEGNAFVMIGRVVQEMANSGVDPKAIADFKDQAFAGDYAELEALIRRTVHAWVDAGAVEPL